MKPVVGFDAERTKYFYSGLGQFCFQLAREFLAMNERPWRPLILAPRSIAEQLEPSREHFQMLHIWQKYVPQTLATTQVWHCTHQDSRYIPPSRPNQKMILTIHDLNFLSEKSATKAHVRLQHLQSLVDRAHIVTTISNFAAQEVQTHLRLRAGQSLQVIYNGAEQAHPHPEKPAFDISQPYFFALGAIRPKKNFHVLVQMMHHFPQYHLMIAGPTDHHYADQIRAEIERHHLGARVHLVGEVGGPQKAWLYQHCAAFLFPSLLEGFGLPVVEAMHWGRPVICSNLTSLPEVGGERAWYWPDFAPDSMANTLNRALAEYAKDPKMQSQRIQTHARQFTWQLAAEGYAKLYESIL